MKRALKLSLAALAAASIVAPVQAASWDKVAVKIAGTYTEATGNGLHFAEVLSAPTAAAGQWRPVNVQPDHTWDYSAGLSFRLAGNDTRLFFEYDHFKDDESRIISGVGVSALGVNAGAVLVTTVSSTVEHKERDFRFGLVHTLHFGPKFDVDVAGALEYAKMQRRQNTQARDAAGLVHASETFNEAEGFGPNMSATGRVYPWGDHNRDWNFYAKAGVALLYSDITATHQQRIISANPVAFVGGTSFNPEDSKSILTRVEADLGVEWTRVMRADFSDLSMGVKLGIKYQNTTNAFKNGDLFQAGPSGLGGINTSPDDFGRMGPFLEFKLGGANA